MCALQATFLDGFLLNVALYCNLHVYDFGDAAPVLTIIQGTGSDLYLILLFEGMVGV